MSQRFLGVTPPVSVSLPTERDLEKTESLIAELRKRGVYPTPAEDRAREIVLGKLNTLVKQFVYESSKKHGLSDAKAREAGGKIFTFGSFRLGVHGPGADIDTLIVAPQHVEREEFFTLFEKMLKQMDGASNVTVGLEGVPRPKQPVPDAYVPIIKSTIMGIEIDLLFANLALPTIPDNLDLTDDNLLKGIDDRCMRSLNGSRVTDLILRLVPNVNVFRDSLRAIKLWAKNKAIYGNVMGFCGGVAWAMLVARICQLYPNGCAGSIISRFFIIMYQWNWPQPVLLKPIEEGHLAARVWNPKLYPGDRSHRMPIITPAYPSMCSTHNVTISTQSIMTNEFKLASEIVDKIYTDQLGWSTLFEPHNFFGQYRYYLQITASSRLEETQHKWSGTVEARLRQLVMKLEYIDGVLLAHPFVKEFEHVSYCLTEDEARAVSIGDIPDAVAQRTQEDFDKIKTESAVGPVYTTTFYIGLVIERKPAAAAGPRKLDISYPTNEFTKMVKAWDQYDADSMGVIVRYIKGSALPEYVFEGRDRKRSVKSGSLKRATEATAPVPSDAAKKMKIVESEQPVPSAKVLESVADRSVAESNVAVVVNDATSASTAASATAASSEQREVSKIVVDGNVMTSALPSAAASEEQKISV